MEAIVKTTKIGGSIMVRVPKDIVEQEGIKAGQTVRIEVERAKKSGFGIAKGVGPFTKEDEMKGHE